MKKVAWTDGMSAHHLRIEVGATQISYDNNTGVLVHRVYGAGKRCDRKIFKWSLDMANLMKSLNHSSRTFCEVSTYE